MNRSQAGPDLAAICRAASAARARPHATQMYGLSAWRRLPDGWPQSSQIKGRGTPICQAGCQKWPNAVVRKADWSIGPPGVWTSAAYCLAITPGWSGSSGLPS